MVVRQDRIRIEVYGPAVDPDTSAERKGPADEAVLRLARLIGRQIAREQFEHQRAKERRPKRKRQADKAS